MQRESFRSRTRYVFLLLLGLALLIGKCAPSVYAQSAPSKTVSEDVVASINNLAKLLCEKLATPASKTELLSPVSIGSMMLLLLRASKRGTRDELFNTLQLSAYRKRAGGSAIAKNFGRLLKEFTHDIAGPGILLDVPAWQATRSCNPMIDDDPDYTDDDDEFLDDPPIQPNVVQLANGIFLQQGLVNNSTFVRMAKELYQAQMAYVNYREQPEEARNIINQWVNETTRGRIEEIIVDTFDRTTQMVIANALYFKATWETFFNEPQYTRPQPFFPDGEQSSSVMVPTMFTAGCFPYHSTTELDARIMGFPYRNRTTSMYVILPNSSDRAKLRQLQTRLDSASLDRLIGQMRLQKAIVQFPRLHVTNSYDLKLVLQQLGLRTLFNRSKSNLRALLPDKTVPETDANLYVTDMLHKIDLEVNERGTEGGAVTITAMERSLPPVNFRVKGPFLIAIRHDPTKMLLFYGAIFDPS
ncbi:serine protease inhibitor 28Dc-like [Anopheles darlingi]|uniref:serine protease inhibitor 28Dc-like n=1 Tax=Anopheles darlingi TaxID=43151 RepID=UPI0021004201|nr:serine protease inhibitor 28Dc-like [Anopheles darlingi]